MLNQELNAEREKNSYLETKVSLFQNRIEFLESKPM